MEPLWTVVKDSRGVDHVIMTKNYAATAESFIEFVYECSLHALAVEYRDGTVVFSTLNADGIRAVRYMAEYYDLTVVENVDGAEGMFELRVSGFGR